MRVAILATSVLLPALLLAAGCSDDVSRVDGAAGPVTAPPATVAVAPPSTTPTTTPTSAPATSPTSPRPPASITPNLGPTGFGTLKLGMTRQQATGTGLIKSWKSGGTPYACAWSTFLKNGTGTDNQGTVLFSDETGVEVIVAYRGVRTPEGIKLGSTRAALLDAYPTWIANESDAQHDGHGWVKVPGNTKATYRIVVEHNKVSEITLQDNNQNCYE